MSADPIDQIQRIIDDGEGSELSRIAEVLGWTDDMARDATIEKRLEYARMAARTGAFRDLLKLFSRQSRQHIANLLAHKWHITAIEMKSEIGLANSNSKPERYVAEPSAAMSKDQQS